MKSLLGGILLAVGILIAGASGLCSLMGLINVVFEAVQFGGVGSALGGLFWIFLIGGIPFAIGAGLILTGRRMTRSGGDDVW